MRSVEGGMRNEEGEEQIIFLLSQKKFVSLHRRFRTAEAPRE